MKNVQVLIHSFGSTFLTSTNHKFDKMKQHLHQKYLHHRDLQSKEVSLLAQRIVNERQTNWMLVRQHLVQ
jgi:hypothetical protein